MANWATGAADHDLASTRHALPATEWRKASLNVLHDWATRPTALLRPTDVTASLNLERANNCDRKRCNRMAKTNTESKTAKQGFEHGFEEQSPTRSGNMFNITAF